MTASPDHQADFGANQDGAQVDRTALTRPGCCADGGAHRSSETADRPYGQENRLL
jgi:hypothetical protein